MVYGNFLFFINLSFLLLMRANPTIPLRKDRNECPSCGLLFRSSYAFDKHRTGRYGIDRRCKSIEAMLASGMEEGSGGFWISAPLLARRGLKGILGGEGH